MKTRHPLAAAIAANVKPMESLYPTAISAGEAEAMERARIEHAPGVAVRMNPRTFRTEYYRTDTGEVVSSHI